MPAPSALQLCWVVKDAFHWLFVKNVGLAFISQAILVLRALLLWLVV